MLHTRELNLLGLLIITFLAACEQVVIALSDLMPGQLGKEFASNGDTAVSVAELSFASLVDWSNK
ncbi:MAG: hypothetical protein IIB74_03445 [Proteobacteria bacterium]|nr:hypothetical protein [Pseudomonadota bacterium]